MRNSVGMTNAFLCFFKILHHYFPKHVIQLMSRSKYGNKVVKVIIKHRTCEACKWWQRHRPGMKPRPHRCVWNHRGSARLLESRAGLEAIKEMMQHGTPVKVIEGDGNNTLIARLKSELGLTDIKNLIEIMP